MKQFRIHVTVLWTLLKKVKITGLSLDSAVTSCKLRSYSIDISPRAYLEQLVVANEVILLQ